MACARCGADLRGKSEPICTACGLEFDWADAVPIDRLVCQHCEYNLRGLSETRCPECGRPFTWEQALADYHRRRNPLFEYHWRDRPVRSLFRTWRLAIRPRKLWRMVNLHDPPQCAALLVFAGICLTLLFLLSGIGRGVGYWCWNHLSGARVPNLGWLWLELTAMPGHVLREFESGRATLPLLVALTWVGASFLALLVFQQSMRLCRIKTGHVVRVWAYSVPPLLPVAALVICAYFCVGRVTFWPGAPDIEVPVVLAMLVHVQWSLWAAYRFHLRMRHALGVAVASQTMAVLATSALTAMIFAISR